MSVEMVSFTLGNAAPPDLQQPEVNKTDGSYLSSKFAGVLQQLSDKEAQPTDHTEVTGTADTPTSDEVMSAQKRKQLTLTNQFLVFPASILQPGPTELREESCSASSVNSTADGVSQMTSAEPVNLPRQSKEQWADLSQAAAPQTLSSTTAELVEAGVPLPHTTESSVGIPVVDISAAAPVSKKVGQIVTTPRLGREADASGKVLTAQDGDLSNLVGASQGVSVTSFGHLDAARLRIVASTDGRLSVKQLPTIPSEHRDAEPASSHATQQEVGYGKAEPSGLHLASHFPDLPSDTQNESTTTTGTRLSDGILLAESKSLSHEAMPSTKRAGQKGIETEPLGYQQAVGAFQEPEKIEVKSPSVEKVSLTQQLENLIDQVKQVHLSAGEATEMHVLLEPKELGKLALRISLENGVVAAHFDAESHIVKQLIEAQLPGLKDVLSQQGIQLEQVSVQVAADSGGGFRHPTPEPRTRQQPRKGNRVPAYRQIESIGMMPSAWVKSGHAFDYSV